MGHIDLGVGQGDAGVCIGLSHIALAVQPFQKDGGGQLDHDRIGGSIEPAAHP